MFPGRSLAGGGPPGVGSQVHLLPSSGSVLSQAAASLTLCSSLITGCGCPTHSGVKPAAPFPAESTANGPGLPLRVTEEHPGDGVEILHSHRFIRHLVGKLQRWTTRTDLKHSRCRDLRIKIGDLGRHQAEEIPLPILPET